MEGRRRDYERGDLERAGEKGEEIVVSLKAAVDALRRRSVFSSGCGPIDILLKGGFRTGEMVEIYGASNTGKTQLAMQATLSAIAIGRSAAFVDTEGTFRPERLVGMAEARGLDRNAVLASVFSIRAENTQQQFESIEKVRTSPDLRGCAMVVVDTVTKNFTLEYGGNRTTPKRQALLGRYLNELQSDAYENDRAVLLTNRVASVGTGGGESVELDIGGETLRNAVQSIIHLARRGDKVYVSRVGAERREMATRISAVGLE